MKVDGSVMTRARQIAAGAVKNKIRADGRKLSDCSTSELRNAIKRHLNEHPEVIEQAAADIERWTLQGMFGKRSRAKLLNSEQKRTD